jgi:hypothetical protein
LGPHLRSLVCFVFITLFVKLLDTRCPLVSLFLFLCAVWLCVCCVVLCCVVLCAVRWGSGAVTLLLSRPRAAGRRSRRRDRAPIEQHPVTPARVCVSCLRKSGEGPGGREEKRMAGRWGRASTRGTPCCG